MNAPVPIRKPRAHQPPNVPADLELERHAIGFALLGYPWPEWFGVHDFALAKHRLAARAVLELGSGASLPSVYALLRDQGHTVQCAKHIDGQPWKWANVEIVALFEEADWALRMGWVVEFEQLRELANQRRLIERCERVVIELRHGAVDFADACRELREVWG